MPDHFRDAFQALKEASEALIRANQATVRAGEAFLAAHDEHIDRGDSIARLESLVLQLSADVRALRDRLDNRST